MQIPVLIVALAQALARLALRTRNNHGAKKPADFGGLFFIASMCRAAPVERGCSRQALPVKLDGEDVKKMSMDNLF